MSSEIRVQRICEHCGQQFEPLHRVADLPGQAGEVGEDWPQKIHPAQLH